MKKMHLGIYGIIENNNSILLVKKSRGPYKDQYDLPGGRPEHGEYILDTLKREIFEETKIEVLEAQKFENIAFVNDLRKWPLSKLAQKTFQDYL